MPKTVDRVSIKLYNQFNQLPLHKLRAFAVGFNKEHKIMFIRKMKREELITALTKAYKESGDFKKSVDDHLDAVVAEHKYKRIPKTTDARKKIVVKASKFKAEVSHRKEGDEFVLRLGKKPQKKPKKKMNIINIPI